MLNKELLLATEDQTAGHIKLTVEKDSVSSPPSFGFATFDGGTPFGSVSKVPCWNLNGKPIALEALYTFSGFTALSFSKWSYVDTDKITMTVVEKGLTVTLIKETSTVFLQSYTTNTAVFNSSDVGKTFTIIFDPEPSGYV